MEYLGNLASLSCASGWAGEAKGSYFLTNIIINVYFTFNNCKAKFASNDQSLTFIQITCHLLGYPQSRSPEASRAGRLENHALHNVLYHVGSRNHSQVVSHKPIIHENQDRGKKKHHGTYLKMKLKLIMNYESFLKTPENIK